jgi:hypothetical protein
MPSKAPSLVYRATIDGTERIGSFFFMYPYNRLIVRRSWHLSRLNTSLFPSHSDNKDQGDGYALRSKGKGKGRASGSSAQPSQNENQEPVHGDELQYQEAVRTPSGFMAFLISFTTFSFLGLFFLSSIVSPKLFSHVRSQLSTVD